MVDSFSWETGIRKIFLGKVAVWQRFTVVNVGVKSEIPNLGTFIFIRFSETIECVFGSSQQDCVNKALDPIVLLHLELQALFRAKTLPGYVKYVQQQHGRSLQLAECVI